MKSVEYDSNRNAIPPIGLKPEDDVNNTDHDKTTFKYKDAAGNRVKKNIIVFGKGSVELLIKWRKAMEQLLSEQKVTEIVDKISAFN